MVGWQKYQVEIWACVSSDFWMRYECLILILSVCVSACLVLSSWFRWVTVVLVWFVFVTGHWQPDGVVEHRGAWETHTRTLTHTHTLFVLFVLYPVWWVTVVYGEWVALVVVSTCTWFYELPYCTDSNILFHFLWQMYLLQVALDKSVWIKKKLFVCMCVPYVVWYVCTVCVYSMRLHPVCVRMGRGAVRRWRLGHEGRRDKVGANKNKDLEITFPSSVGLSLWFKIMCSAQY